MFLFRLALALGRSVEELLQTISYRELLEWQQFYAFDPFDEQRADLRNAMLMSLLANQNRDKRKRAKPYTVKEFMPPFGQLAVPKQTAASHDSRDASRGARVSARTLTGLFILAGAAPVKE